MINIFKYVFGTMLTISLLVLMHLQCVNPCYDINYGTMGMILSGTVLVSFVGFLGVMSYKSNKDV